MSRREDVYDQTIEELQRWIKGLKRLLSLMYGVEYSDDPAWWTLCANARTNNQGAFRGEDIYFSSRRAAVEVALFQSSNCLAILAAVRTEAFRLTCSTFGRADTEEFLENIGFYRVSVEVQDRIRQESNHVLKGGRPSYFLKREFTRMIRSQEGWLLRVGFPAAEVDALRDAPGSPAHRSARIRAAAARARKRQSSHIAIDYASKPVNGQVGVYDLLIPPVMWECLHTLLSLREQVDSEGVGKNVACAS